MEWERGGIEDWAKEEDPSERAEQGNAAALRGSRRLVAVTFQ